MAKNNSNQKEKKVKKSYRNPVNTIWGKIIVWTIAILTACSGLITVIYLIAQNSR